MLYFNVNFFFQDSAIFRMSGLSLNTNAPEEVSSPRSKTRQNSCCDDDEPIVIKIKRRDKDGKVTSPLHTVQELRTDHQSSYNKQLEI